MLYGYYVIFGSHKLKEANETRYWMLLLIDNNIVPESKLAMMLDELNQIIKILIATTKKLKE